MKMEIKKCSEINCPYVKTERICPDDWFDDELRAECSHQNAPKFKSLGCDDSKDYLNIPEWCPRLKEQELKDNPYELPSEVIGDNYKEKMIIRERKVKRYINSDTFSDLNLYLIRAVQNCRAKGFTWDEIYSRFCNMVHDITYSEGIKEILNSNRED